MKRVSIAILVQSFVALFVIFGAVEVWLATVGEGIRVISAGSVMSVSLLATPIFWVVSAVLYVGDKLYWKG